MKPRIGHTVGGWLEPGVLASQALTQIQQGRALSALGDGHAATREFQKIIDHRGVAPLSLLYPLAHLQQGRAHLQMGEIAKAREAFEAFLSIWKDADSAVPILIDARREYEKLLRTPE